MKWESEIDKRNEQEEQGEGKETRTHSLHMGWAICHWQTPCSCEANSKHRHPRPTASNDSELLTNFQSHCGGCFRTRKHIWCYEMQILRYAVASLL